MIMRHYHADVYDMIRFGRSFWWKMVFVKDSKAEIAQIKSFFLDESFAYEEIRNLSWFIVEYAYKKTELGI